MPEDARSFLSPEVYELLRRALTIGPEPNPATRARTIGPPPRPDDALRRATSVRPTPGIPPPSGPGDMSGGLDILGALQEMFGEVPVGQLLRQALIPGAGIRPNLEGVAPQNTGPGIPPAPFAGPYPPNRVDLESLPSRQPSVVEGPGIAGLGLGEPESLAESLGVAEGGRMGPPRREFLETNLSPREANPRPRLRSTEGLPITGQADVPGAFSEQVRDMFDAEPLPSPPGPWEQLGSGILSGLVQNIVPAAVAFAAKRTNNPELVNAWSQARADEIRQAQLEMERELAEHQMGQDTLAAERAAEELALAKAQGLVDMIGTIGELQTDLAGRDPFHYINAVAGMSPVWEALGGDAEQFAELTRFPMRAVRDNLQAQFDAQVARFEGAPESMDMAIIQNPMDPSDMYTLREVATILNYIGPEGDIVVPLGGLPDAAFLETEQTLPSGEDIQRVESRTSRVRSGARISSPGPDWDTPFTSEPDEFGRITAVHVNRTTGETQVQQFIGPIPDDPLRTVDTLRGRRIREAVEDYLRFENEGRPPTEQEILDALSDPEILGVAESLLGGE